jgi:uncharacterized protein YacL
VSEDRNTPERKLFRGAFVEFIRLIIVAILATAGYAVSKQVTTGSRVVLGIILGSAVGYVAGGVLGRGTASAMHAVEREFRRTPAAEIVAGALGLLLGLVMALLVTFPLFKLPDQAAWPSVAFVYLVLPYLGYRVARTKHGDLFSMLGLKPRAAGVGRSEINVIDTSALIDGRMAELVRTGFLGGVLLIPQGVLGELQRIADSSDGRRRMLGRRGMDLLAKLQRDPTVEVILVQDEAMGDVDAGLVRMARDRGASVVTADANLAKVAEVLNVPVRSINALADAMRTPFTAGESIEVRLIREGRDHGQAIGYLDDGTMVVVEHARERIGSDVEVQVKNVLQTTTGRMLFATLAEQVSPS